MKPYREAFARAVEAAVSGVTVLTENTRSARAIVRAAEEYWRAKAVAWPSPDVLPYGAFLERLYRQAVVSGLTSSHLLSREQELHLWRRLNARARERAPILLPECAAELAAAAFRTACEYAIPLDSPQMSATSESREFAGWAAAFRSGLAKQGWICAALLEGELRGLLPRLALPPQLFVFLAEPTPAQREFLAAIEAAGSSVQSVGVGIPEAEAALQPHGAVRHEFGSEAEELSAAAHWARRQLEATPEARIGVIFFDLAGRLRPAASAFSSVLEPQRLLGESAAQLYEIALAASLAEYPMIRCALGLLSLLAGPVEYQFFDATLRSPYLGFQAGEMARFLRRIRAQAHREVSPEEFFGWLRGSELSGLREAVERLPAHAPFASQQPVEHWSAFAEEALKGFGWPKGVALNSEEFQCLESWNELFASVASLEALGWRTDFAGFVARLERAAAARRFKPESLGTPVQIMDVAEAEGSTFDALWIGGSSDEQWPALSALSPLLPTGMQKAAGVPTEGTAHGEERVRRITARLLSSAPRIVLSLARRCEDEREQRWSPLFTKIPMTHAGEVAAASLAARFAPATLESMEDAAAPALADGEKIHGGTSLLEEQSGCPFRAFAIRRLHAPRAEGPHEPLEATLRGKIIELAMELIWRELGDSDGLGRSDLEQVIERSVKRATAKLAGESQDPWKRQLFEVERKRTTDVIGRWLSVERRRRPFRVLAHQQNVGVELAGLRLAGKIDRLDEMGGEQVVIDYKTGKAIGLGSWSVPRPLHPQLPFYALAKRREGANIAGIAFASIRCDEQCFRGYLRDKDLLPIFRDGARRYFDGAGFDDYLPRWEEELERLARSFAAGDAAVDPRLPPVNSNSPCRRCHLQALCRIGDLPPNSDEEESGEAGDE